MVRVGWLCNGPVKGNEVVPIILQDLEEVVDPDLVDAGVAAVGAVHPFMEVVVVLVQGDGLVPAVLDRDAQAVHEGVCQHVAPAPLLHLLLLPIQRLVAHTRFCSHSTLFYCRCVAVSSCRSRQVRQCTGGNRSQTGMPKHSMWG